MQAKNFSFSKLLKPIPLLIFFALLCLALDWLYPVFLSKYSFLIILACSFLFGFFPKQSTPLKKEKNVKEVSLHEAAPQVFKFKTFLSFQDLIQSTLKETIDFIENLPPSSISIFVNLSSKNQRYPVSLSSLIEQIKEASFPVLIHPILSLPQKKLSINKPEAFLSVTEKKQTVPIKKLDIKASSEHKAYIELAVLLSLFKRCATASQKLKSVPFFCKISENLFEHKSTLQILKDVINHPDFPKHHFIFVISSSTLSENTTLLEDFYKEGFQIGIHAEKLPVPSLPIFLQFFYIDLSDLRSSLKGLARRQFSHTVQTLTEQPYKVILGEIEDGQVLQDILPAQFDFACGPALGEIELWESSHSKKS